MFLTAVVNTPAPSGPRLGILNRGETYNTTFSRLPARQGKDNGVGNFKIKGPYRYFIDPFFYPAQARHCIFQAMQIVSPPDIIIIFFL